MTEQKSNYRHILKATSLFGGVQVIGIVISMVQSKFIAVLLGPEGMGISGLLKSTVGLVESITSFGIGKSAVRNVAAANAVGDSERVSVVITVLRRCVWITGVLGFLVVIVFSKYLSKITFGNSKYEYAFIWLSITLLLNQLSNGQIAVLTGLRRLKQLANANLTGSILGLLISLPLYYMWGINGIVPAIILGSVFQLLRTWAFSRKEKMAEVTVSKDETIKIGRDILTMGIVVNFSEVLTFLFFNLIRIFLSRYGGVPEVGLYNAGHTITKTYVGMVFSSLRLDYYPRLASVIHDDKYKKVVDAQIEIVLLILVPMLMVFLVYIDLIIQLLFSNKFLSISEMISWMVIGVFFKAIGWPITYIFLSKGDSRLYFINELTSNIYTLIFNVLGYLMMGLTGLGLSIAISLFIYFVQLLYVSKVKYHYRLSNETLRLLLVLFVFILIAFILKLCLNTSALYIAGGIMALASITYSLNELNKRIDLRNVLSKKK